MEYRYLFRGKRIDNGEWVEGNLIQNPFFKGVRSWISSEQEDKIRLRSISRTQALWNSIEVDSSTICQCTGLNDKNGNLIWENDIVGVRFDNEEKLYEVGSVEYGAFNCSCCDGVYGWYFTDSGDIREVGKYEVIGNIFDNPELLEVQE